MAKVGDKPKVLREGPKAEEARYIPPVDEEKEKLFALLQKNKYSFTSVNGVIIVIIQSGDNLTETVQEVAKLVKESGYDSSWGVSTQGAMTKIS